jgi:hypothetical protein
MIYSEEAVLGDLVFEYSDYAMGNLLFVNI